MAKRRRRRSGGLGAVAKHGSSYTAGKRFSRYKQFKVGVEIGRDIGASTKNQYQADACVRGRKKYGRPSKHGLWSERRCGSGRGRTPTAAGKKALRDLAKRLK